MLERRAIENYFTDSAVHAALGESHAALGPYDLLRNARSPWDKKVNWKIAKAMTKDQLLQTDLGAFLGSL